MAANNILPFCPTDIGTNLLTDADYLAASDRISGNKPGVASARLANKALRQSSLIAAGVAQFIANYQGVDLADTLTPAQIAAMLADAVGLGITLLTASATLTPANQGLVLVNASGGNIVVTLPSASALASLNFTFLRIDSLGNNVTVLPVGADVLQPGGLNAAALATNPCFLFPQERLEMASDGGTFWFGSYTNRRRYLAFAASAAWRCPPFVTKALVRVWGAGGSGGASSSAAGAGGGGGGGGHSRGMVELNPGTTYTATVGFGGGSVGGSSNGVDGGASNFGGLVTATGGAAGGGSAGGAGSGGAGGVGSGGALSPSGSAGGSGYTSGATWMSGTGGGTPLGASIVGPNAATAGTGGSFPGGGGNGGAAINVSGSGAAGLIELEF